MPYKRKWTYRADAQLPIAVSIALITNIVRTCVAIPQI